MSRLPYRFGRSWKYLDIIWIDIVTIVAGREVDNSKDNDANDEKGSQDLQSHSPIPGGDG